MEAANRAFTASILAALITGGLGALGAIEAAKIGLLKPSEVQVERSPKYIALQEKVESLSTRLAELESTHRRALNNLAILEAERAKLILQLESVPQQIVRKPETAFEQPARTPATSDLVTQTSGEWVLGEWRGSYFAGQGKTGLTLIVRKDSSGDRMLAIFSFYPLPENPVVIAGEYTAIVSIHPSGTVSISGSQWVRRPENYTFVNLAGSIDGKTSHFKGVVNGNPAWPFSVQRVQ
jgi:hypothetical protein